MQPDVGSHVSTPLQALPSSHVSGVPGTQSPFTQLSVPLQTLLSMQSASLVQQPCTDVCVQPSVLSQASVVQRAPSLHCGAMPATQPVVGSHVSVPSQALPSLQLSGVPGRQFPPGPQVSTPLQTLLSRQSAFRVQHPGVTVWTQAPVVGSQESAVQRAPSSQFGAGPAMQPSTGSQSSTPLQGLPSSHTSCGPGTHELLTHVSWPLQTLPSSQSASVLQKVMMRHELLLQFEYGAPPNGVSRTGTMTSLYP